MDNETARAIRLLDHNGIVGAACIGPVGAKLV